MRNVGYMVPPDDFDRPDEHSADQATLTILGLAYQGRFADAISLADKIIGEIYPSRGYRGGLEGAASYYQLEVDTYVLQGNLTQAEQASIFSRRLLSCSRAFDGFRVSQGAIRARDQAREKYFATHPEAMEEWLRNLWNSFSCPPATEDDRTLAWKAMGDICWKYLRLSAARDYYRLALPRLRDLEARKIKQHLQFENHYRTQGAARPLPPLTRDQWLAKHPEELKDVSETEASLARVEKALTEW